MGFRLGLEFLHFHRVGRLWANEPEARLVAQSARIAGSRVFATEEPSRRLAAL
jgi:hypothetical protein